MVKSSEKSKTPQSPPGSLSVFPNPLGWKTGITLVVLALAVIALSQWKVVLPPFSSPQEISKAKAESVYPMGVSSLVLGEKIPLNQATSQALQALPGMGPGRAEKIIQWRSEHGPFSSLDELRLVPGIGERTLWRIRPFLSLTHSP